MTDAAATVPPGALSDEHAQTAAWVEDAGVHMPVDIVEDELARFDLSEIERVMVIDLWASLRRKRGLDQEPAANGASHAARMRDRREWAAWQLAADVNACEALMAGLAVPRRRLKPDVLARIGEPAAGPDVQITDAIAWAVELRVEAGDAPAEAAPPGSAARILALDDFLAQDDEPAVPAVGSPGETLLPIGGLVIVGGEGGATKTTFTLDAVAHFASGTPWLGHDVPRPLRILIIENEGPRPQFREKLQAKLDNWDGRAWRENVFVWHEPWANFSFANEADRVALRAFAHEHAIDLVVADPLDSLGIAGAGKPEETREFVAWLRECGLHDPAAPLGFWLLHHFSKRRNEASCSNSPVPGAATPTPS